MKPAKVPRFNFLRQSLDRIHSLVTDEMLLQSLMVALCVSTLTEGSPLTSTKRAHIINIQFILTEM